MIYIKKNPQGEIIDIQFSPSSDYEKIHLFDPQFTEFLKNNPNQEALVLEVLKQLDQEMVRTIEDLIDLLMGKGLILFTDLPEAVQNKLLFKKHVRETLNQDSLLLEEEELTL